MGAANINSGQVVCKKVTIELTPEEKLFLEANKQKREVMRPNCKEMNSFGSIFIDNIKIDEIYDLIYSNKTFDLYGKAEKTFFGLISKKTKNYNFEITEWDHPGPEFYSQIPEHKFDTSPFSSKRKTEQDHNLPYIPFFPKNCHCVENAEIFWISD